LTIGYFRNMENAMQRQFSPYSFHGGTVLTIG